MIYKEDRTKKIQYDDYEWGMKKSEVKRLIKEKDYKILYNKKKFIGYIDSMFDNNVLVELSFTPKSKQLYHIGIYYYTDKDKSFFNHMIKKYEKEYNVEKNKKNEYYVKNKNKGILIRHNVENFNTEIGYVSQNYFQLYEKEKEKNKK